MPKSHDNWVIGPADQAIKLLAEETIAAGLIQHALVALSNFGPLLHLAEQQIGRAGGDTAGIHALLATHAQNERLAQEMIADDFGAVIRHGIIGMWVAVEVAVEDTALLILRRDPSCLLDLVADGVKRLPAPLPSTISEAEAKSVYKKLEPHARTGRRVAEGYCYMLQLLLGVPLHVQLATLDTLCELNAVRNCLLHRSGVVDAAAAAQAPALGLSPGESLKISSQRYLHYFDAAASFARALLDATLLSRHAVTI